MEEAIASIQKATDSKKIGGKVSAKFVGWVEATKPNIDEYDSLKNCFVS